MSLPKIDYMKRILQLLTAITLFFISGNGNAQIVMSATGSNTQNFNTLASTGTNNTFTDNSTISSWYSQRSVAGSTYAADNGALNSGNLYSYGTTATTERALGSLGSGSAGNFAHGAQLRNTSGAAITDIRITYTLEQWRNGGNTTPQSVTFWYKTNTSAITALTPNTATGWTQVTALTTTSPINTASAGALDGNLSANKVTVTNISIPSLSLANNSYIMLKWEDPDNTGSDHGLAIDDVTINWTVPVASPQEIDLTGNGVSIADGTTATSTTNFTDFGSFDIASGSLTRTFIINNTGGSALSVGALSFSGATTGFTATQPLSSSVAAGGNTSFTITYNPSVVGAETIGVILVNGDSDENPYNFNVTGTGTASPEINVQGNGVTIVNDDDTASLADHTDFGAVDAESGTISRTYTIQNTGSSALTITDISLLDPAPDAASFSITTPPASSVAAGGSTTFVVTFDPTVPGLIESAIFIDTNDTDESTYAFVIQGTGTSVANFANVQFPTSSQTINEGSSLTVYAQVYEPGITEAGGAGAGVQGWIGYNAANTNPNTGSWIWVPATFNTQAGNNDEFQAAIGASLPGGTYYYASRFQIGTGAYTYGGNGGNWNNNSVQLTVTANTVDFANIQSPTSATIPTGGSVTVYAQTYELGLTPGAGQGAGVTAWIGYNSSNTNPNTATWTWVAATYNAAGPTGNNDEYSATIGSALPVGIYYYASRFLKSGSTTYVYGGTGGNWNNDSGVLTVATPQEINVTGNSVSIVSGDSTPATADDTDFGTTTVGNTIVKTFTIQNTGGIALTVTTPITVSPAVGFTITQQPAASVSAAGTTTFQVTYTPTTTTAQTAVVNIGNNDSNENPYTFSITGTATLAAPVAIAATAVQSNQFTANWNAVSGATGYRLDVSTNSSFPAAAPVDLVSWNFPNNPDNATADSGIAANASKTITVVGATTLLFNASGATTQSVSATAWTSGSGTKYWEVDFATTGHSTIKVSSKQRSSGTGPRDFKLQYKVGAGGTYADVTGGTVAVTTTDFTAGVLTNVTLPSACDNQASVFLRWIMTSNTSQNNGTVAAGGVSNIDDISITGTPPSTAILNDFAVTGTSSIVTGLTPSTTYYYRVRAVNGVSTSPNSNTISVTTIAPVSVGGTAAANQNICGGTAPANLTITGQTGNVVRWEKASDSAFTTPVTIVNTTTTLTGAQIGNLSTTTYFRAVVQNGAAPIAYSSAVTITVSPGAVGGTVSPSTTTLCSTINNGTLTLSGQTGGVVRWESSTDNFATAGTSIANTSTSYTFNNVTTTMYYRAVVQTGTCQANSAIATVSLGNAVTTWNGATWSNGDPNINKAAIFNADYESVGDMSACSVTVTNNAYVAIKYGFDLTISSGVTVDAGSTLFFERNCNLIQLTNVTNTGNIHMMRSSSALDLLDYTLWSSPVAGQNLLAFSPNTSITPTIRFYNYNTMTNQYNSVPSPATTNFADGKGYLIRVPVDHIDGENYFGEFIGVPHNGSYNIPMVDGGAGKRFNLVGNPYPSPVNLYQLSLDNQNNITGVFYFWRKKNGSDNPSYCSWTSANGFVDNGQPETEDPLGVLQTGQGFLVEGKAGQTNFAFNNAQRVGNNDGQFFRVAADVTEKNRLWLNATSDTGAFSQTLVSYITDATLGFDYGMDGKFMNDGAIALSSLVDAETYVMQARPLPFDNTDIVPLNFKATAAGTYHISIDHADGFFEGDAPQTVYLKDNLTGVQHDLNSGAYTFSTEAGTFATRFQLEYTAALGTNNPSFNANSVVVYNQNGNIVINSGNITLDNVQVYDIRGRLLVDKKGINASETSLNAGTTNQVLIVKITSDDNQTVTRKVVN
jgi:hypothetical protein